jgi:hypothetical protein
MPDIREWVDCFYRINGSKLGSVMLPNEHLSLRRQKRRLNDPATYSSASLWTAPQPTAFLHVSDHNITDEGNPMCASMQPRQLQN